jgi:hypothetical protein
MFVNYAMCSKCNHNRSVVNVLYFYFIMIIKLKTITCNQAPMLDNSAYPPHRWYLVKSVNQRTRPRNRNTLPGAIINVSFTIVAMKIPSQFNLPFSISHLRRKSSETWFAHLLWWQSFFGCSHWFSRHTFAVKRWVLLLNSWKIKTS